MSKPSAPDAGTAAARPVAVLGAGGHARVVAETAALCGCALAGHLAPAAGVSPLLGAWLGTDDAVAGLIAGHDLAIGLGFVDAAGARRRAGLLARLSDQGARLATLAHPSAILSPSATLAEGAFVAMGAMIGTGARIGRGAIINSGAIIDHDSSVGENTHVATGVRLAGGVTIGRDVLVGAGSVLRQGVTVGDGAVVGAGAVVVADVAAGTMVIGNPARKR